MYALPHRDHEELVLCGWKDGAVLRGTGCTVRAVSTAAPTK